MILKIQVMEYLSLETNSQVKSSQVNLIHNNIIT